MIRSLDCWSISIHLTPAIERTTNRRFSSKQPWLVLSWIVAAPAVCSAALAAVWRDFRGCASRQVDGKRASRPMSATPTTHPSGQADSRRKRCSTKYTGRFWSSAISNADAKRAKCFALLDDDILLGYEELIWGNSFEINWPQEQAA
jgi:hypothetical protein